MLSEALKKVRMAYSSKTSGGKGCVWSPISICEHILFVNHSTPLAGHPGVTKTFELVTRYFWWQSLHADVTDFEARCDACQKAKSRTQKPPGLLQSLPIPAYPWQHVTMDFVTGLPATPRMTALL